MSLSGLAREGFETKTNRMRSSGAVEHGDSFCRVLFVAGGQLNKDIKQSEAGGLLCCSVAQIYLLLS